MTELFKIISDAIADDRRTMNSKIETYVKLKIQPKPWFIPTKLWHRIVARVVMLEIYESYMREHD